MLIIMRDRFLLVNNPACCLLEMMDGVQTAVLSTCISCETGARRHAACLCALMQRSMCLSARVCARVCACVWVCVCVCVRTRSCVYMCFHDALFDTFSRRDVCYPCLLESDPRLCLIGVFTLSGLTHTDMPDLGSTLSAMKRENSVIGTCLPPFWGRKHLMPFIVCFLVYFYREMFSFSLYSLLFFFSFLISHYPFPLRDFERERCTFQPWYND